MKFVGPLKNTLKYINMYATLVILIYSKRTYIHSHINVHIMFALESSLIL